MTWQTIQTYNYVIQTALSVNLRLGVNVCRTSCGSSCYNITKGDIEISLINLENSRGLRRSEKLWGSLRNSEESEDL